MTTKVDRNGIHTDGGLISPDSPEWYQWLESAKSFRFETDYETFIDGRVPLMETLTFSGVKIKSGKGEYWQAHKKVDGVLRREHLGKNPSYARLKEIANLINSSAYWHQKKQRSPKLVSVESHNQNCETVNEVSSQAANEIAKLEEELLDLQTENMRLQEENAKLKQKFEGLPEREREMREEINRLMRVQLENDTLKAWNQDLRTALENNPSVEKLLKEYETGYETIKPTLDKAPKDVTRNWVEFWRFKQWLLKRLER